MASQKIPESYDPLVALLEDAADGARDHAASVGLQQNTEAKIRADLEALVGTAAGPGGIPSAVPGLKALWNTAKADKVAKGAAFRSARSAGRTVASACVNVLKPRLGNQWNNAWQTAGFTNASLAIPENPLTLLQQLRAYFAANTAHEVPDLAPGLAATPIVASWHLSETDHFAFSLNIWASTGDYDAKNLANLGLNTWTFIPGIAYTKVFPKANVELSVLWSVLFYTENDDTGYENGTQSDLSLLAVKRFNNGLGLGVIGGWIEQLTDDKGSAPAPFKGRGFGVGPALTYSTKIGSNSLDLSSRWIHEFESRNRFEGDTFMLSAGFKF